MSQPLFCFSQINALDTVPLHHIKTVVITGDKIKFNITDDEGNRDEKTKLLTPFIKIQIDEYGIEKFEA